MKLLMNLCAVLLLVCGACQNKVKKYYNSVKDELHAKNDHIHSILKSCTDTKETDLELLLANPTELPQEVQDAVLLGSKYKSKLHPLQMKECFIVNIEAGNSTKSARDYFAGQQEKLTDLYNDGMYKISKKDSVEYEPSVESFRERVEAYKAHKYLVVLDCSYYKRAKQGVYTYGTVTYDKGHVIKKVQVYDIDSQKLLDSYQLYATSSNNIKYERNGTPDLTADLGDNTLKSLGASLFY